jgi:hypothetical protein
MSTTATLATTLVPQSTDLLLEDVVIGTAEVSVSLLATRSAAPCPLCGCLSKRIPSHYQRTLADLPWRTPRKMMLYTGVHFDWQMTVCVRRLLRWASVRSVGKGELPRPAGMRRQGQTVSGFPSGC